MAYRTLDRVIEELKERGFVERFDVRDGQLRALGSGRTFDAEDITIREYQRFEGVSDPDDASVVYAIETGSGVRALREPRGRSALGDGRDSRRGEMNRKRSARLTVLLTTDGSRQAHAALAFAAAVPWAGTATAHMVLARGGIPLGPWPATQPGRR